MRILETTNGTAPWTVEGYSPARRASTPSLTLNRISPVDTSATPRLFPSSTAAFSTLNDNKEILRGLRRKKKDDWTRPPTAIHQRNLRPANKYYRPGRNPIGLHVGFGSDPGTPTPIGSHWVVKDIQVHKPRDDIPECRPLSPTSVANNVGDIDRINLPSHRRRSFLLMPIVREKLRDLDPNNSIYRMRTTEVQSPTPLSTERMDRQPLHRLRLSRHAARRPSASTAVMAYTVANVPAKSGIRMALGAATRKSSGWSCAKSWSRDHWRRR